MGLRQLATVLGKGIQIPFVGDAKRMGAHRWLIQLFSYVEYSPFFDLTLAATEQPYAQPPLRHGECVGQSAKGHPTEQQCPPHVENREVLEKTGKQFN